MANQVLAGSNFGNRALSAAGPESGFPDVDHLINTPEFPNAVQWADDGTLAVATGWLVNILHPSGFVGA